VLDAQGFNTANASCHCDADYVACPPYTSGHPNCWPDKGYKAIIFWDDSPNGQKWVMLDPDTKLPIDEPIAVGCGTSGHGLHCQCDPGYDGVFMWNNESMAYSNNCTRVPCPPYADGAPNCTCKKGYQESSPLAFNETSGKWDGSCTKVNCVGKTRASVHPECPCRDGYTGLSVFDFTERMFSENCSLAACPSHTIRTGDDKEKCECEMGFADADDNPVRFDADSQRWEGRCSEKKCPQHSIGHPHCYCEVGYVGDIAWVDEEFEGVCEKVPCPPGGGGDQCACHNGYISEPSEPRWNDTAKAWTHTCTAIPACPAGCSATDVSQCQCDKIGFVGNPPLEWTGQEYGTCKTVSCPPHTYAIHGGADPACDCDVGYTGAGVSWSFELSTWMVDCNVAECPAHARCSVETKDAYCNKGYAGVVTWNAEKLQWESTCTKINCPDGSGPHPNCACKQGYSGGDLLNHGALDWEASGDASKYHGVCHGSANQIEKTEFICQGPVHELKCDPGLKLTINSAMWGRKRADKCMVGTFEMGDDTGCSTDSALTWVSAQCNNKESCRITPDTTTFGHPCQSSGYSLYLEVDYTCQGTPRSRCDEFCEIVSCPTHSSKNPDGSCSCDFGYQGKITFDRPVYTGDCQPAACPPNATGLGPTCACPKGYLPSHDFGFSQGAWHGECILQSCGSHTINFPDCVCEDNAWYDKGATAITWSGGMDGTGYSGRCVPWPCPSHATVPGECKCGKGFRTISARTSETLTGPVWDNTNGQWLHACEYEGCPEGTVGSAHPDCQCAKGYAGRPTWSYSTASWSGCTVVQCDADRHMIDLAAVGKCGCAKGYVGSISWSADGQRWEGGCTAATCPNEAACTGSTATCGKGYVGSVAWNQYTDTFGEWIASCERVDCPSNSEGHPDCTCKRGYAGGVVPFADGQYGTCSLVQCPKHSEKLANGNCLCHEGYSGDIVWLEDQSQYNGECEVADCVEHAVGGPSCYCDRGYYKSATFQFSRQQGRWLGQCHPLDCPDNSKWDSVNCTCAVGYAGTIHWDSRQEKWETDGCFEAQCPLNSGGPGCKCFSGYTGIPLWSGGAWTHTCHPVECPEGTHVEVLSDGGFLCRCTLPSNGVPTWTGMEWDATCVPVTCPLHSTPSDDATQCICDSGYQGRVTWNYDLMQYDGTCGILTCPDPAIGPGADINCDCPAGYTGGCALNDDPYRWECTCAHKGCPSDALRDPETDLCNCRKGFSGRISWVEATSDWDGSCTQADCPTHAIDHPNCTCPKGYVDTVEWDSVSQDYTGSCSKSECPTNAVNHPECTPAKGHRYVNDEAITWNSQLHQWQGKVEPIPCPVHSDGAPDCKCKKGYASNGFSLSGSGYVGSCDEVACTNNHPGFPDCYCAQGYTGEFSWTGTGWAANPCQVAACPDNANGGPACKCNDGWKGSLKWNATTQAWEGECERVPCPAHSDSHPNCKCLSGYTGSIEWSPATGHYLSSCTMATCPPNSKRVATLPNGVNPNEYVSTSNLTESGTYRLKSANGDFDAYVSVEGGEVWVKAMQWEKTYSPSASRFGFIASSEGGVGKLSDDQINFLSDLDNKRMYRFDWQDATHALYVRTTRAHHDGSPFFGLGGAGTQTRLASLSPPPTSFLELGTQDQHGDLSRWTAMGMRQVQGTRLGRKGSISLIDGSDPSELLDPKPDTNVYSTYFNEEAFYVDLGKAYPLSGIRFEPTFPTAQQKYVDFEVFGSTDVNPSNDVNPHPDTWIYASWDSIFSGSKQFPADVDLTQPYRTLRYVKVVLKTTTRPLPELHAMYFMTSAPPDNYYGDLHTAQEKGWNSLNSVASVFPGAYNSRVDGGDIRDLLNPKPTTELTLGQGESGFILNFDLGKWVYITGFRIEPAYLQEHQATIGVSFAPPGDQTTPVFYPEHKFEMALDDPSKLDFAWNMHGRYLRLHIYIHSPLHAIYIFTRESVGQAALPSTGYLGDLSAWTARGYRAVDAASVLNNPNLRYGSNANELLLPTESTKVYGNPQANPATIEFDLGKAYPIAGIRIEPFETQTKEVWYEIFSSQTAESYQSVMSGQRSMSTSDESNFWFDERMPTARYWKLQFQQHPSSERYMPPLHAVYFLTPEPADTAHYGNMWTWVSNNLHPINDDATVLHEDGQWQGDVADLLHPSDTSRVRVKPGRSSATFDVDLGTVRNIVGVRMEPAYFQDKPMRVSYYKTTEESDPTQIQWTKASSISFGNFKKEDVKHYLDTWFTGQSRYWRVTVTGESTPALHALYFISDTPPKPPLPPHEYVEDMSVHSSHATHENGPISNILTATNDNFANFDNGRTPPWWVVFDMGSVQPVGGMAMSAFVADHSPKTVRISFATSATAMEAEQWTEAATVTTAAKWGSQNGVDPALKDWSFSKHWAQYWRVDVIDTHSGLPPTIHFVQFYRAHVNYVPVITVQSSTGTEAGFPASNLAIPTTHSHATYKGPSPWATTFDLLESKDVIGFEISSLIVDDVAPKEILVHSAADEAALSDGQWTTVGTFSTEGPWSSLADWEFDMVSARFWKVTVTETHGGGGAPSLHYVRFIQQEPAAPPGPPPMTDWVDYHAGHPFGATQCLGVFMGSLGFDCNTALNQKKRCFTGGDMCGQPDFTLYPALTHVRGWVKLNKEVLMHRTLDEGHLTTVTDSEGLEYTSPIPSCVCHVGCHGGYDWIRTGYSGDCQCSECPANGDCSKLLETPTTDETVFPCKKGYSGHVRYVGTEWVDNCVKVECPGDSTFWPDCACRAGFKGLVRHDFVWDDTEKEGTTTYTGGQCVEEKCPYPLQERTASETEVECACPVSYYGKATWNMTTQDWDGDTFCSMIPCGDAKMAKSEDNSKCTCPVNWRGRSEWSPVTMSYEGDERCVKATCPDGATCDSSPVERRCHTYYSGSYHWDYASQTWSHDCSVVPCPANARPLSDGDDPAGCECFTGFHPPAAWSAAGQSYSGCSQDAACPVGALDTRHAATNGPTCECKPGFIGMPKWEVGTSEYKHSCTQLGCYVKPGSVMSGTGLCDCAPGYTGALAWTSRDQWYEGSCSAAPCPTEGVDCTDAHNFARPSNTMLPCEAGYHGAALWDADRQEWDNQCQVRACPVNSLHTTFPDCECKWGFGGTVTWVAADQDYSSTCERVACPSPLLENGDGHCRCARGTETGQINFGADDKWTQTCSALRECPADSTQVNGDCFCNKGFKGTIESVVSYEKQDQGQQSFAEFSTEYKGKCVLEPCPDNSLDGSFPSCRCARGFKGAVVWDNVFQEWVTTCAQVACPANAAGAPDCSCKKGYLPSPASAPSFDMAQQTWNGTCFLASCPEHAQAGSKNGVPTCRCKNGYAGVPKWEAGVGWTHTCTEAPCPDLSTKFRAVSDTEYQGIPGFIGCHHEGVALGVVTQHPLEFGIPSSLDEAKQQGELNCQALLDAGAECWGFAVSKHLSLKLYTAAASDYSRCDAGTGLKENPDWTTYRRKAATGDCQCLPGYGGGYVWNGNSYVGSCQKDQCPPHSSCDTAVTCDKGYAGAKQFQWDFDHERWEGTCHKVACGIHDDATSFPACKCARGYLGGEHGWDFATEAWTGQCTKVECVDNSEHTDHPDCRCSSGFIRSDRVPNRAVSWSGTAWEQTCEPVPCPPGSKRESSGGCRCVAGYSGRVAFHMDSATFTVSEGDATMTSCARTGCPENSVETLAQNADGTSTITCACKKGYAGDMTWNFDSFSFGQCHKVDCPAHSSGHPHCMCDLGYHGELTWTGSEYAGQCTEKSTTHEWTVTGGIVDSVSCHRLAGNAQTGGVGTGGAKASLQFEGDKDAVQCDVKLTKEFTRVRGSLVVQPVAGTVHNSVRIVAWHPTITSTSRYVAMGTPQAVVDGGRESNTGDHEYTAATNIAIADTAVPQTDTIRVEVAQAKSVQVDIDFGLLEVYAVPGDVTGCDKSTTP
jgi:hypothetical protein